MLSFNSTAKLSGICYLHIVAVLHYGVLISFGKLLVWNYSRDRYIEILKTSRDQRNQPLENINKFLYIHINTTNKFSMFWNKHGVHVLAKTGIEEYQAIVCSLGYNDFDLISWNWHPPPGENWLTNWFWNIHNDVYRVFWAVFVRLLGFRVKFWHNRNT